LNRSSNQMEQKNEPKNGRRVAAGAAAICQLVVLHCAA